MFRVGWDQLQAHNTGSAAFKVEHDKQEAVFEKQREEYTAQWAKVREHLSEELCGPTLPSPLPCYGPLTGGVRGAVCKGPGS